MLERISITKHFVFENVDFSIKSRGMDSAGRKEVACYFNADASTDGQVAQSENNDRMVQPTTSIIDSIAAVLPYRIIEHDD